MIVHNYDSLWKIKKKLYSIEKIKLPIGIEYAQILYYFTGVILVSLISRILRVGTFNFGIQYVLLPMAFAWAMTHVKLDGKNPYRFIITCILFFLHSHKLNRYQAVKKPEEYSYNCKIWKVGDRAG